MDASADHTGQTSHGRRTDDGRRRSALVVGGGIGGLAAAVALREAGWDPCVLERAPAVREVGAGIALWANGLRALRRLGLGPWLRALRAPHGPAVVRARDGTLLTRATADELRARHGETLVAVHRAALQGALLATLGERHVRTGAGCVRVWDDGRAAHAQLADGTVVTADVLIGADGLHSVVRAALHGDAPPRDAGYTAWRAVIDHPPARALPGETMGHGARFGIVPLPDGRVYWFAVRSEPPDAGDEDAKARLLHLFARWHAPIPELIAATPAEAIIRTRIADRPPLRWWGRGRITLVGDAAHPMTPNLGQGACQALEDAVALADALRDARDPVAALRRYEARRRPRANAIVRRSRAVGAVGQWRHPLAVLLRALLFRYVFPILRDRHLRELARDDTR